MKISTCCQVVVFEKRTGPNQTTYFCKRCLNSCEIFYWNNPLSPHEELIIFHRYPLDRKEKKSTGSLAKGLGKSSQRIRYIEKRAAMKILKVNDMKYKPLKKRIYEALRTEPSYTRAQWKNVFIEQYDENKY